YNYVCSGIEHTGELLQLQSGKDDFVMLLFFAFIMLIIRRYEWGVSLATLLVVATSFPLYILARTEIFGDAIDIDMVISGAFAAITLVIAIGVFLGHISTISYLLVGVLFVPSYMFLEWYLFEFLDGAL